jgi:hypothetical protein
VVVVTNDQAIVTDVCARSVVASDTFSPSLAADSAAGASAFRPG